MPNKPEIWNLDQLTKAPLGNCALIATPSVVSLAQQLPFDQVDSLRNLRDKPETLIVIGGGTLIDEAKLWRREKSPTTRLVAIPSLWGSGAEASPVAVLDRDGTKEIHVDEALLPDVRCIWPELADSVPPAQARAACGDAWAHALEGFLSPLADEALRSELANIIEQMLELPLAADFRWFEVSAQACAGQARASVGLTHGIAHVLEGPLSRAFPDAEWGHARLCAIFLWPVMSFNRYQSDKPSRLFDKFGLDESAIFEVLRALHEPSNFNDALPLLVEHWIPICRDVCSRTNCTLVRQNSVNYFNDREFQ